MNIREICEKQGLTIAQLAHKLGVSENLLYKVANGSRQMSRNLEEKIKEFTKCCTLQGRASIQLYSGDNCTNTGVSVQAPPAQPSDDTLSVVPSETIVEQLEVVQDNNELLQKIREDQKRELNLKREQSQQLNEVLSFIQGLDDIMQHKVKEVIDDRTRTIIAASNHHIHSQALVMLTAIEGIINMVEADLVNKDIFLKQLSAVRNQLRELSTYNN